MAIEEYGRQKENFTTAINHRVVIWEKWGKKKTRCLPYNLCYSEFISTEEK